MSNESIKKLDYVSVDIYLHWACKNRTLETNEPSPDAGVSMKSWVMTQVGSHVAMDGQNLSTILHLKLKISQQKKC